MGKYVIFSASKTLPCKYVNSGDSEEFQFASNAIPVGGEFQVCRDDFCITGSNGPENEPEYVTLPISDISEQPSDTNQPPVEVQPSDTSQPPNQGRGHTSGLSHLNGGRWTVEGEVNTIKETVEVRGNFNFSNLQ